VLADDEHHSIIHQQLIINTMDDILDSGLFDKAPEFDSTGFQTYRSFHSIEEAKIFAALLVEHDIPYLAETSDTLIDKAIVGTGLIPKVVIKIAARDFKKVNVLLDEQLAQMNEADIAGHYLNQLEDKELAEIFRKPDEWSVEDVRVAQVILKQRDIYFTDEEIQSLREERLSVVREGKKGSIAWMAFYFIAIVLGLFVSLVFTIAGIGMGYYYSYSKSVDPDGYKYFTFEPETRKLGKWILYGGIGLLMVEIVLLFWL
jgi:hypothetical protein